MSTIEPNREVLVALSPVNVNAQFAQQYGNQVFSYSGTITPEYQVLCQKLTKTLDDLAANITAVKSKIPKVNP